MDDSCKFDNCKPRLIVVIVYNISSWKFKNKKKTNDVVTPWAKGLKAFSCLNFDKIVEILPYSSGNVLYKLEIFSMEILGKKIYTQI